MRYRNGVVGFIGVIVLLMTVMIGSAGDRASPGMTAFNEAPALVAPSEIVEVALPLELTATDGPETGALSIAPKGPGVAALDVSGPVAPQMIRLRPNLYTSPFASHRVTPHRIDADAERSRGFL